MKITHCKVNHMKNPCGYQMGEPVFSYVAEEAKGKRQTEARIVVREAKSGIVVADTGFADSIDHLGQPVPCSLQPRTKYEWKVTVRTDAGEEAISDAQYFETGKMEEPWMGRWITCKKESERHPVFQTSFSLEDFSDEEGFAEARLYICGLGLYDARLNGKPVTEERLTPYCNDYSTWVQCQTYDVSELLERNNQLSVTLAPGWYMGRFGFTSRAGQGGYYGTDYKLMKQI